MNKNNNWLIWVIAVVAILALILAIIAVNLGITGKSIFSFGKKSSSNTNSVGVGNNGCQQPAFDNCVSNCASSNPVGSGYNNCVKNCGENYCSNSIANKGTFGIFLLSRGGNVESLKGYEVKYDTDGNLIYEITNGRTFLNLGENYTANYTGNNLTVYTYQNSNNQYIWTCGCISTESGSSGQCTGVCTLNIGSQGQASCSGFCTGEVCSSNHCALRISKSTQ